MVLIVIYEVVVFLTEFAFLAAFLGANIDWSDTFNDKLKPYGLIAFGIFVVNLASFLCITPILAVLHIESVIDTNNWQIVGFPILLALEFLFSLMILDVLKVIPSNTRSSNAVLLLVALLLANILTFIVFPYFFLGSLVW
jgi:hypothetical protein